MLRREPQTRQSWEFGRWEGAPSHLAHLAQRVRDLLPDGEFKATVRLPDNQELVTETPGGLGSLKPSDPLDYVEIEVTEFRAKPRAEGELIGERDFYSVVLQVGRLAPWNRARCVSPTELETRAMLVSLQDAIGPHATSMGRWINPLLLGALISCSLPVSITFAILSSANLDPTIFLVIAAIPYLLFGIFVARLMLWLFPTFELYEETPRRKRFALAILTGVVVPSLISVAVALINI